MLKPFTVEVSGFGAFAYPAASRGRALAEAWGDYVGCYNRATFKDFLRIARVRKADHGARFGEPITVAGQPAFYVGERGQYVRFVRPGETQTFLSHPADVAALARIEAFGRDGNRLDCEATKAGLAPKDGRQ